MKHLKTILETYATLTCNDAIFQCYKCNMECIRDMILSVYAYDAHGQVLVAF